MPAVEQRTLPPAKASIKKRKGNEPDFDLRGQHYRILGVDLTAVPGMSSLLIHSANAGWALGSWWRKSNSAESRGTNRFHTSSEN